MIGKSNRVYEVLNYKRSLTLKMIWNLHAGLGIPAESLIKPPQDAKKSGYGCQEKSRQRFRLNRHLPRLANGRDVAEAPATAFAK